MYIKQRCLPFWDLHSTKGNETTNKDRINKLFIQLLKGVNALQKKGGEFRNACLRLRVTVLSMMVKRPR